MAERRSVPKRSEQGFNAVEIRIARAAGRTALPVEAAGVGTGGRHRAVPAVLAYQNGAAPEQ